MIHLVVTGDSPYFEQFAFGAVAGKQAVSGVEFPDVHQPQRLGL